MATKLEKSARRLEGKVAIITGGASGIGECAARLFWANGAKVVIADIQDEQGRSVCRELDDSITYVHCDITEEDHIIALIDQTISKHGKLDIMYNNAGIMGPPDSSILTIEKAHLERALKVNVVGAFLGTKHAARVMVPQRRGCILFTGSATASTACMNEHAYVASKRAVVGLAQNVSAELGQFGIRVNCVSPYAVATPMAKPRGSDYDPAEYEKFMSEAGNLKRVVLKAEDVAKAALFLASDEARYVSGLNLVVDGGFSIANPSVTIAFNNLHQK